MWRKNKKSVRNTWYFCRGSRCNIYLLLRGTIYLKIKEYTLVYCVGFVCVLINSVIVSTCNEKNRKKLIELWILPFPVPVSVFLFCHFPSSSQCVCVWERGGWHIHTNKVLLKDQSSFHVFESQILFDERERETGGVSGSLHYLTAGFLTPSERPDHLFTHSPVLLAPWLELLLPPPVCLVPPWRFHDCFFFFFF